MITEQQFSDSACALGVPIAAIKAVAQVESGGAGIINGLPVIRFEAHVFWKQLRDQGADPQLAQRGNEDILYPVWNSKEPSRTQKQQYDRLDRASKINRNAALQSASWGKFQIMGYNWKKCGCISLQQFINAIYHSEDDHLKLFCTYIKISMLDDELKHRDWEGFARQYNGALYWKNAYDVKLRNAYNSFKIKQP